MKKVLFVATLDSHINHFHLPYLKYFKNLGYEVHVATDTDRKIKYCDKKIKLPIERSPYSLSNIKAIRILRGILKKEKYDIIHCHTPVGSVVARVAAIGLRKAGTKVIYTAHGFHFYKGAPIINWCIFYPIEKLLAHVTDILITINKEDYSLAQKKFKTEVRYIPGIGIHEKFDIDCSNKEICEIKKELGLTEKDFILIYSAELIANKNQEMIIDVMKNLRDYLDIKLILPGKDSRNGYYQKYAEGLDNVIFLGYRSDIEKVIKIASLAISVSIREGFGLNLAEAMNAGKPIIATNNRGHKEIVKDGFNGYLVEIGNTKDLEEKILKIYNDKNLYKMLSKNALESSKRFKVSNVLEEMRKIYEEVM